MSDPTKNLPWHVLNNSEWAKPDWGVYDSTGELVAWFPYGGHYARTSEQAEALARMVAAGSVAELLRAENERLKSQVHELQLTFASQDTEYRELHELQSKTADSRDIALAENNRLDRLCGELRAVAGELAAALNLVKQLNPNQLPLEGYVALAAYAALNPQEKPT